MPYSLASSRSYFFAINLIEFLLQYFVSGDPFCSPPNISLPLSTDVTKATKMKKSEVFVFTAEVAINCHVAGQNQMVYKSETFAIDLISGSLRRSAIRIGTTVRYIETTIRGSDYDYGYYLFTIKGNIEGRSATKTSSFGYIEVTSTNLVANITGARRVSQGLNDTLTLNGSLSHDPDVGPGKYAGLEFTWLCRRNNEIFPKDITALPYVFPQSRSTSQIGQDVGGCYGTGVGKLKPRDGMAYIVDLNVDKMKGDQDYVIKLIMRKRGLTAYAVHLLRIKEEMQLKIV